MTVSSPARRPPLKARVRYAFDRALSRGPSVVIGWLGLLTLAIIVVSALVLTVFRLRGVNGGEDLGIAESFWQSLLRVLDSGSFAADGGWTTRVLTLIVTLSGIFIAGSLIGLIASAVDQQIEALRKGRSKVLEHGHTLILGWSPRVPAIVAELVVANESMRKATVVVLADADKTMMEDTLRDRIDDPRTTRIVCRSGLPSNPADLTMANFEGCRSVIVVEPEDSAVVKALLAIRSLDRELAVAHVVAEVRSAETASSLRSLIGPRVVPVNSDDVVAELTAQACRQRGLSRVFRELLDFDGDELYIAPFDELVGATYADAQLAFRACAVLGRLRGSDHHVELNPAPHTVIESGDELIAIASDDSMFRCTGISRPPHVPSPSGTAAVVGTRRIIVVGWSDLGPRVVRELDEFFDGQTVLELVLDPTRVSVQEVRDSLETRNVVVEVAELTGGPEVLAAHAARRAFNEVVLLGQRGEASPDEADTRTLLTLVAFRQVVERESLGDVRIVAELLDQRNAPLAQAIGADDFIVSDELTSLMLAQLSERQELADVFADLFDRAGSTIELRPASTYGAHQATDFAQVVASASALGHSALGYHRRNGELVVNPDKAQPLSLDADDEVLVLS